MPPEPLPILPERPAVPGPGVYAVKGGTRVERPFDRAPSPLPTAEPPPAAPPPVVVIQPPPVRRTRPVIPAATDGTPTPVPVVVQRTVVVGTPAQGPPRPVVPPRTRRPAQPIPYVVKEGSHPHLSTPRTPGPTQTTAPVPPRPPASPASLSAPRTSAVTPTRAAEVVADKSLDEVILAYLAQGASTDKR